MPTPTTEHNRSTYPERARCLALLEAFDPTLTPNRRHEDTLAVLAYLNAQWAAAEANALEARGRDESAGRERDARATLAAYRAKATLEGLADANVHPDMRRWTEASWILDGLKAQWGVLPRSLSGNDEAAVVLRMAGLPQDFFDHAIEPATR